jgi:hypothetical protein
VSARRRKAAFDPGALGDLDDLLPTLSVVAETVDEPYSSPSAPSWDEGEGQAAEPARDSSPVVSSAPAEPDDESPGFGSSESEAPQAQSEAPKPSLTTRRRTKPRSDSSAAPTRSAPPEVYLPPAVYAALRQLTLEEKQRDRATARPYGQVVLDAVEKHADELQRHWNTAEPHVSSGLFKRREASAQPRRRRHSEIQARVPLAGIIASDTATLDALVEEWSAGSRSALVEHALRLYLDVGRA